MAVAQEILGDGAEGLKDAWVAKKARKGKGKRPSAIVAGQVVSPPRPPPGKAARGRKTTVERVGGAVSTPPRTRAWTESQMRNPPPMPDWLASCVAPLQDPADASTFSPEPEKEVVDIDLAVGENDDTVCAVHAGGDSESDACPSPDVVHVKVAARVPLAPVDVNVDVGLPKHGSLNRVLVQQRQARILRQSAAKVAAAAEKDALAAEGTGAAMHNSDATIAFMHEVDPSTVVEGTRTQISPATPDLVSHQANPDIVIPRTMSAAFMHEAGPSTVVEGTRTQISPGVTPDLDSHQANPDIVVPRTLSAAFMHEADPSTVVEIPRTQISPATPDFEPAAQVENAAHARTQRHSSIPSMVPDSQPAYGRTDWQNEVETEEYIAVNPSTVHPAYTPAEPMYRANSHGPAAHNRRRSPKKKAPRVDYRSYYVVPEEDLAPFTGWVLKDSLSYRRLKHQMGWAMSKFCNPVLGNFWMETDETKAMFEASVRAEIGGPWKLDPIIDQLMKKKMEQWRYNSAKSAKRFLRGKLKNKSYQNKTMDPKFWEQLLDLERKKVCGEEAETQQMRAARRRQEALVPQPHSHLGNGGLAGFQRRFFERYEREATPEEEMAVRTGKGSWRAKVEAFWEGKNISRPVEAHFTDECGNLKTSSAVWREYKALGLETNVIDKRVMDDILEKRCQDDGFLVREMLPRISCRVECAKESEVLSA